MHIKCGKWSMDINLDSVMLALIIIASSILANAKFLSTIYLIIGIVGIYVLLRVIKRPYLISDVICTHAFSWIFLFGILMFLYGYFGPYPEAYSFKFHMSNLVYLFFALCIIYTSETNTLELVTVTSIIVLIYLSVHILLIDQSGISQLMSGQIIRVGQTESGNVNSTAILYVFFLIPVVYQILVKKKRKYISIFIIGVAFTLITGSKKGIFGIALLLFLCLMWNSENSAQLWKNFFKAVAFLVLFVVILNVVPTLHELIWVRIVAMMDTVKTMDMTSEASTSLRLRLASIAFIKSWEHPLFGHGWDTFANMYGTTAVYTKLYSHCNYTELLFSFGLIGFLLYYSLPFWILIKLRRARQVAILAKMYVVLTLFKEIAAVSCYDSIISQLSFIIAYTILMRGDDSYGQDQDINECLVR